MSHDDALPPGPDFSQGVPQMQVPAGGVLAGRVGNEAVLLARLDDGFHAVGGSCTHYGAPLGFIGQGGTIPLMSMLAQGFPSAQMMVCGVLGPKSNAHGPNEFLHVPYAKRLTAAVSQAIAACP